MIEDGEHRPLDKYELFFAAGSYAMVPELLRDPLSRKLTNSFIRYGLDIDDCWDFGLPREVLNGTFVDSNDFFVHLDPEMSQRLNHSESHMYAAIEQIPDERRRERLVKNLTRFKESIMLTEGLALSVPFQDGTWPAQSVETYRFVDTMIWGAMYIALKSNSRLILPDVSEQSDKNGNPHIRLSRIYNQYVLSLLQSGSEGYEALSLSWQMMYVQYAMDKDDRDINKQYRTPAFHIFPSDVSPSPINDVSYHQRESKFLQWARDYQQKFSFTLPFARIFPFVYGIVSNSSEWRSSIEGWGQKYITTTSSAS